MLCAAIDIGSNTTRLLVAEPVDGQLKKVMEQRAYTRINKAIRDSGEIPAKKASEVAEVVATQVRLARELGAETIRAVATAAVREASNGAVVAKQIGDGAGVPVEILSEQEEGRLSFIGATKTLGHPVDGLVGVVDVGGGSTEVILGTVPGGVREVRSWRVGSGVLADELIASDPPSAAEIRKIRDRIDDLFADVQIEQPAQAVAAWSGRCWSTRRWSGGCASSAAIRPPTSRVASSSTLNVCASSPPASCCWRNCPSCLGSLCRSARVACARALSSTSSTAMRMVLRRRGWRPKAIR